MSDQIQYNDGAAYERSMGVWSRIAGKDFLDWIALPPNLRWVDIGCGNGAFTELIVAQCAPAFVHGIDPSEAQLAFARSRLPTQAAAFDRGDAMTLPVADGRFDVAVMALVIFFVPEPAKGVAEMIRVVRPGGTIATYAWDILGGGFPIEPFRAELQAMGVTLPLPSRCNAARMEALRNSWTDAGLENVATQAITVQRTFANFDDFWSGNLLGATIGPTVAAMPASDVDRLKARLRTPLPGDSSGHIVYSARANTIRGRVPA